MRIYIIHCGFQSIYDYVESLEKLVEMFADVFECFVHEVQGFLSPKSEPKTYSNIISCGEKYQLINQFMANLEAMKKSYEVTKFDYSNTILFLLRQL